MRLITNLLLVLLALVFAGCAAKGPVIEQPTVTDTIYVYAQCGNPPERDLVFLMPITWQVTDGNFSLTPKGYKDLAYNMAEITRGVKLLRIEIDYYKKCLAYRGKDGGV